MNAGRPGAPAESLSIAGPAGRLEALAELPDPGSGPPLLAAVICHPHPLFGGTLHNKVVHTLARTVRASGGATLRFNFRGVGTSEGTHDGGPGEVRDALAAVTWARVRWPGVPLVLAGFSFGGAVAIEAAVAAGPAWLVTVAPAVDRVPLDRLELPRCEWLVVQGDADDVVAADSVVQWMSRWAPQARVRVLSGVGHFFHGRLHDLQACLREEWPRDLPAVQSPAG